MKHRKQSTEWATGMRRSEFIKAAALCTLWAGLPDLTLAGEKQATNSELSPGRLSGKPPDAASGQNPNAGGPQTASQRLHNPTWLVVSPDGPADGGDFGPRTPGTRTSGLQEAFNRAHEEVRDLYIVGGGSNHQLDKGVSYRLDETLHIPWMQNFRLDGGEYALFYAGEQGDAVVIDSQMNCRFKFGLIAMQKSDGAVVRIAPMTKGPDNFACCVASTFEFNGLVGAGNVWGKSSKQKSTGLVFDTSHAGISGNRIFILEINGCRVGAFLMQGAGNNLLEAQWVHLTNLGVQLGEAKAPGVSGNRIIAGISGDIPHTTGVQVFGHNNSFWLDVFNVDPQRSLVLEESAYNNLVMSANLADGVTNRAKTPGNRLMAPFAIEAVDTPPFPASQQTLINPFLVPVEVQILTSGMVSQWTQTDLAGKARTIKGGLAAGQTFILRPAEAVQFAFDVAPTWFWKGL